MYQEDADPQLFISKLAKIHHQDFKEIIDRIPEEWITGLPVNSSEIRSRLLQGVENNWIDHQLLQTLDRVRELSIESES